MQTPTCATTFAVCKPVVRTPARKAVYKGINRPSFVKPFPICARAASTAISAAPGGSSMIESGPATPLNVVFVSAECAPWSKTGGLGDVVSGLPLELAKRGHKVLTVQPRYDQYKDAWDTSTTVNVDGEEVRYFHIQDKGVDRIFVDNPLFLAKVWGKTGSKLYGPRSGMDYIDNQARFKIFCTAAIEACRMLPFSPGEDVVFIANDWHSALVPVLLKDVYQPRGEFTSAKAAFCIHNIAFQGRFWEESFSTLGLPESSRKKFVFTDGYNKIFDETSPAAEDEKPEPTAEQFQKLNWMKAGMIACDKLLTVSPNYASEVAANSSLGVELDDVVREVGGIEGIVNGMDLKDWNPTTDKYLTVNYDVTTVAEGKLAAKEALQAQLGLPVQNEMPLIGFVGRLEEQKGIDIMMAALPKALTAGGLQVAILGTGKRKFETLVKTLDTKFPGAAAGVCQFNAPLAHKIFAGCDYIIVPSRFEPCGLIQLQAMCYGAIPLVSSVGGLVDTVKEGVTGLQMGRFDLDEATPEDADAVAATISRAVEIYGTPLFEEMRRSCISQDLSWKQPAKKWEGVLEELKFGAGDATTKKDSVQVPVDQNPVASK